MSGRSSGAFGGASKQRLLMMQLDKTINSHQTSSLGTQLGISAAGLSRDGWGSCLLCCSWSKFQVGGSDSFSCSTGRALPGEQGGDGPAGTQG